MVKKNKAVFLDRDGVLVKGSILKRKLYAARSFENFYLYPKTRKNLLILKKLGYKLIIITNQPDVGKNLISKKTINKMNNYLYEELPIDKIYVCAHSQNLNCKCRKPKTYFFKTAIKNYKIDPKISFMVGDRKTDILAGNNIGCKTIFINRSYLEEKPSSSDRIVRSFSEAVNFIYKFK